MKKALLLIGIAILGAALAGAGFPAGQKVETVNGVRTVHNTSVGTWGKTPAVSLQPVRVLGDVDSDDEAVAFHMPSGLALDAQGRIYVLDTGNHRVQVFGPDGKFLKTIGRKGQGPGEFFSPDSIGFDARDHLYVGEGQAARIQEFLPDGKLGQTLKLVEGGLGDFKILPEGGFLMDAGSTIRMIAGAVQAPSGGSAKEDAAPLLKVLDRGGKTLREFGRPAVYDDPLVLRTANRVMTALAGRDGVCAVFPFQNRIDKYSLEGKLLWRADRKLDYNMEIKSKGGMTKTGSGNTMNVTMRMPDMVRCASGAAVDGRGRLWVATLARQLRDGEKVRVTSTMSNDNSVTKAEGAVDLRTTDAYKLEVYGPDGVLLGALPVKTFVDGIFIRGDRLFLLDKLRGVQFHEFKIVG